MIRGSGGLMKQFMSPDASSIMGPTSKPSRLSLRPFDKLFGPLVAGWVQGEDALFRLAPGTAPPLTAAKVGGWTSDGDCPLLLWAAGQQEPCGYAELNTMESNPGVLWLGHLLLRPELRGQGWESFRSPMGGIPRIYWDCSSPWARLSPRSWPGEEVR